jgi:hypothetical protein
MPTEYLTELKLFIFWDNLLGNRKKDKNVFINISKIKGRS